MDDLIPGINPATYGFPAPVVAKLQADLDIDMASKVDTSSVGAPDGVAPLDGDGVLPEANVPERLGEESLVTLIGEHAPTQTEDLGLLLPKGFTLPGDPEAGSVFMDMGEDAGVPKIYSDDEWHPIMTDVALAADIVDPETTVGGALSATFAPADLIQLRRMDDLASASRSAALARSQVDYADAVSVGEVWSSLAAWSSATFGQVSAGRFYSDTQGGSSGANRSFAIPSGGKFRAVFNVRTVSGLTSGGMCIGVSKDTAGGAATSGAGAARGIYFRTDIATMDNGTATSMVATDGNSNGVPSGTTDWVVTVASDGNYLSIVARSTDNTREARAKWAVSGAFPINNLYVFNSDTRELTGHSVGAIGARKFTGTYTPRTGIEDQTPSVMWSTINGAGIRAVLPANYDSRKPAPVAILCHGNGSTENHFFGNTNGKAVSDALTAAGYIVVSAAHSANTSTWGSTDGLNAIYEAYKFARDNFAIGPVVIYGNSMGGIEALGSLAQRRIPGVVAVALTNPTYDLDENHANALFTSTIDTAYGGNYAVNSIGHDPAAMPPTAFRGIPAWVLIASDDASVTPAANGYALVDALETVGAVTQVDVTGGHSTSAIASNAAAIVTFFNANIQ